MPVFTSLYLAFVHLPLLTIFFTYLYSFFFYIPLLTYFFAYLNLPVFFTYLYSPFFILTFTYLFFEFPQKFVAIVALAAIASSAPAGNDPSPPPAIILKQSQDGPNPDGSYSYSYETSNGISVQEQGSLQPASNPDAENKEANTVQGSYAYPDENGNLLQVTYTADENGYQAQGAHLPVAPAVPEAILKALEWIAAHPEEDNLH